MLPKKGRNPPETMEFLAEKLWSSVAAPVLGLPNFFTSHASTERVLTSVLEDTRGARGEEIRQRQRQGRMADHLVGMGADMGAQLLGRSSIS